MPREHPQQRVGVGGRAAKLPFNIVLHLCVIEPLYLKDLGRRQVWAKLFKIEKAWAVICCAATDDEAILRVRDKKVLKVNPGAMLRFRGPWQFIQTVDKHETVAGS